LLGEKKWSELSEFQHVRLIRQVSVLRQFHQALQEIPVSQKVPIEEVRKTVCQGCPFEISPDTVAEYHQDFLKNGGIFF
jgi:hypothetical protein